jgi:rfaE bifunctional protein kinase chain/domain
MSVSRASRLQGLVDAFRGRRVLVIADLVADEFVYGRVERISREAPVLILRYDSTDVRLGGGANAVHNIATLGGRPIPFGVLGRDDLGRQLRKQLKEKAIGTSRVVNEPGYATPVKTRILGGSAHTTTPHCDRIYMVTTGGGPPPPRRAVLRALRAYSGPVAGVLVSDYGFGLLSPELVKAAVAFARRRGVPVAVDSRFDLLRYKGMTAVTPNESEVETALGITIGGDRVKLEAAGRTLLDRLACQAVLITRGSHGMSLLERGRPALHIPIHGSDEVADVTGAGDTVIATFTLALAAGATAAEASRLANYAGSVVVMKHATASVSSGELLAAVREGESP